MSAPAMLSPDVHAARRRDLMARLDKPVLLMGNREQTRNLPMNKHPFRQDSTFLYFTGCDMPGVAALITPDGDALFVPAPADDDALWHGHAWTVAEIGARYGFEQAHAIDTLPARAPAGLAALAVPEAQANALAASLTGSALAFGVAGQNGDEALIEAVIAMRRTKTAVEIDQHRAAAAATAAAFRLVMAGTRPGGHEREIAALFVAALSARGCATGYPPIVTVRGEVLHNFHHVNPLNDGDLLLLDGGAEVASGYGVDITRTWPVSGRYSPRQRAAYDAVLAAQDASIALCRSGVRYRAVHDASSRVLAQFLVDEGLVTCSPDAAVESGAHALFFPHGVGHLLGLDVHDLENFGDRAAYAPGRTRSEQFGTGYLRMDMDLEPGILVTVEPGFYVVPAILADPALRERFAGQVDFAAAEGWAGFGGIRIEDDVLVTDGAPEVLTHATPKDPDAVEALVGSGAAAGALLGL